MIFKIFSLNCFVNVLNILTFIFVCIRLRVQIVWNWDRKMLFWQTYLPLRFVARLSDIFSTPLKFSWGMSESMVSETVDWPCSVNRKRRFPSRSILSLSLTHKWSKNSLNSVQSLAVFYNKKLYNVHHVFTFVLCSRCGTD